MTNQTRTRRNEGNSKNCDDERMPQTPGKRKGRGEGGETQNGGQVKDTSGEAQHASLASDSTDENRMDEELKAAAAQISCGTSPPPSPPREDGKDEDSRKAKKENFLPAFLVESSSGFLRQLTAGSKKERELNRVRQQPPSLNLRRSPMDNIILTSISGSEFLASEIDLDGDTASRRRSSNGSFRISGGDGIPINDGRELQQKDYERRIPRIRRWMQSSCLSPKYHLKTQLMLSFGSANLITIILVFVGCIVTSHVVGENLKQINQEAFEKNLLPSIQARTVRYLAESLQQQFMPVDMVDMLIEAAQDRFQGYPSSLLHEKAQETEHYSVPFRDVLSGNNIYPVIGKPMFLNHEIPADVTEDNYQEHVQDDRWHSFYKSQPIVSTKSGLFSFQGVCDPAENFAPASSTTATASNSTGVTDVNSNNNTRYLLDESNLRYECTEAHNDIDSGGVIHPVPTTGPIFRAGSDIIPVMKAMFESKSEIRDLGIYFANMGAGASMNFPAYPMDMNVTYTSIGCDWMSQPNPVDPSLGPIANQNEIQRCHAEGETVSNRVYNPMERAWCRDQALNPSRVFLDSYIGLFSGQWLLSIGRAIYDRETNEFVACTYIGISLMQIQQELEASLVTENSVLSLIRFDRQGTVIASTAVETSSVKTAEDVYSIDQLQVGLSAATYESLRKLHSTFKPQKYNTHTWDPTPIRDAYQSFSVVEDGFLVAVSPIPGVPDEYDPDYRPEFFVIMSTATDDVFAGALELNDDVDGHIHRVFMYSAVLGMIGLGVTVLIVLLMSYTLTIPLHYIHNTSGNIVRRLGENAQTTDDVESRPEQSQSDNGQKYQSEPSTGRYKGSCLTPKTELSDVLDEFNTMVANFSGSLMAKSEKSRYVEVRNTFNLRKEFSSLYASRMDPDFKYNFGILRNKVNETQQDTNSTASSSSKECDEMDFVHFGSNIETSTHIRDEEDESLFKRKTSGDENHTKRFRSPLFLWTVGLFVTPLLLTTTAISAVALITIRDAFRRSSDDAMRFFVEVEANALSVHARLRAELVSGLSAIHVRDTYILTRYFGWLLFGGLERADSFTDMLTVTEECKTHSAMSAECPYVQENYVCDCAWESGWGECSDYPAGSRHLQRVEYSVEKSDALPDGDRNATSYPLVCTSMETTEWWDNLTNVPGSEKGSSASGHDTLYDRLRVTSAMPLFPVLHNYKKHNPNFLAQWIAFEADGLFAGYTGCSRIMLQERSAWKSTEENRAAALRPELCPLGKHGYDPRCRGWYDDGRRLALEKNISMHVTAPHMFALSDILSGQSITMPLVDPVTGEYVGQVLYDMVSNTIFDALNNVNTPLAKGGFPFLISLQGNPDKNAVLGPNYEVGFNPKEISRVVIPADYDCGSEICQQNVEQFNDIVASMKAGESLLSSFTRTMGDGTTEIVRLASAPVKLRSIKPINGSNFARGIEVNEYLIYSLALCETEDGLLKPFQVMEDQTSRQIRWAIFALAGVIALSALFVVFICYLVATSITEPMLHLLELIRRINQSDFRDGEPLRLEGSRGSNEIVMVSDTVLILFRIVRGANDFFFAGKLEMAYRVLEDALAIFKKLGNEKAIAVTSNNLGNVMLAMYREMVSSPGMKKHSGLTKKQMLVKGREHFQIAIKLGEKAYDEYHANEGWTSNCLDFMQHLSNRYFNRALFTLMVKKETKHPKDIVESGTRDLEIARDMDLEIIEYGKDIGFNRENRSHKLFHSNLVRARGHNFLLELGYPDATMSEKSYPEDWELGTRLDEVYEMLVKEHHRGSSELFADVNVIGRLQETETEIMKYKKLTGDLEDAARVAIRMLYEDAFIFAPALSTAVDVLVSYVDKMDIEEDDRKRIKMELVGYEENIYGELENIEEQSRHLSGSLHFDSLSEQVSSRLSMKLDGSGSLSRTDSGHEWVTKHFSGGFVTMEDF